MPNASGTVVPGAEPWSADGDHVGILVLHGFTGSPASVRPGSLPVWPWGWLSPSASCH